MEYRLWLILALLAGAAFAQLEPYEQRSLPEILLDNPPLLVAVIVIVFFVAVVIYLLFPVKKEKAGNSKVIKTEKDIKDSLSLERTRLAEERTHLAYIRTGMSMILGGIFFIGYFPEGSPFSYVGYATIALSLIFTGYGFYSHKKTHRAISKITLGFVKDEE